MKPTSPRVVLFAPNWLGDAVMSLPAVADVRRAVPDASLAIAVRPSVAPLFSLVPGIDEVVELSTERRAALRVEQRVRSSFDTAILFPNSFATALGAWRAGISERWGYRTDWRRPLLTRAIEPPVGVHQVEYYQRLVAALGFPNASPFPGLPRIALSNEWRETGLRELRGAGWDGVRPLVALAPGAAYGGSKRWPPTSFADLARTLEDDGIQTVLVGSRADLPVAREIERALEGRPILNLMATDLPTLAGTLCACRALVSNDSGAMHLASAVGVRVTAVFGPTDERLTRPAGDGHVVLSHPVWCRPCMMRECPIDHRCMRGVGVDRVVGAVRQML
ncbi:MAG TPA: lipopolysaccharide heptosyltransferase II [Vicinamibacterales bacterium]|jgi:heptosyltransferase-2|nr:lipopolysaccharide heptosyltransferase II [Vicinamibacterales bacterium]